MKNLVTVLIEICVLITITGFGIDTGHNFDRAFVSSRMDSPSDEIQSDKIPSKESATAYKIINGRIDDYNRTNLQFLTESY